MLSCPSEHQNILRFKCKCMCTLFVFSPAHLSLHETIYQVALNHHEENKVCILTPDEDLFTIKVP